ncbi:MAG: tRNA (guanosine(18)-2'-O)-methyltransferase TrmH [Acidobacteriota bacterium]
MTAARFARLSSILDRRQPDLTVLLDDLQKAHNVSAVIRTCDAVGIPTIHAVTDAATFKAKTTSAAGSERFVEVHLRPSYRDAVEHLHAAGFHVVAAHQSARSVDFRSIDYTRPVCVAMGQEGPGVSAGLLDVVDAEIEIPMVGAVASLNVSVATAVVLFEAQRQRRAAGFYDQPRLDPTERHRLLFEWGYPKLARFCQDKGIAYPELGERGEIVGEMPRG